MKRRGAREIDDRPFVSIVCGNRDEFGKLQLKLGAAGISSFSTQNIENVEIAAPGWAVAVVIYPDHFAEADLRTFMRQLGRMRPRPHVMVVTDNPERFGASILADRQMAPAEIFARPSRVSDIASAIRAHVRDV